MQFTVAAKPLLIQVDKRHEPALIHSIDAVGDFHLVGAADLIEHHLTVRHVVLVEQLLGLGAVWAEACAEHGRLLLTDYLSQALGVGWLADGGEKLCEERIGCAAI